ncbi:TIGR02300 family protein [Enterovirga rhinocerotis]|uniref:Uncharacterized protein (TIGR02300 family) n=1 Tax=Enterovirga rhinocerotis TaxID=1339210 RepID=A0A4R7BJJ1_9HYPH|nr:TIGR02300 family protein [Enterovirga rhinocerotis]TDR85514.1 uncharacterized protein (TIGR02300 family) [Enterovirga rhinocerotis]
MARPELGTKRVCPTTGRKFYDLNRDPIVSPYTGEVLARAAFEPVPLQPARASNESDEDETDLVTTGPETVSLEDAAAEEESAAGDDTSLGDDDEGGAPDDDTFLEEEEEGGDVSDLIDSDIEDDEES